MTAPELAARPSVDAAATGSAREGILLASMCTASVVSAAGATMVTVALPRIGVDLHAGYSSLQWVANVYTVVLATLVLPATTLAGNVGRRRTYCGGMLLVVVGSFVSAGAPVYWALLVGRLVQATGAALVGPTSLAIIAHQFTEPAARSRAVGMWAAAAGIGLAIGPLVAGAVIGTLGWPAVFWIVGVVAAGLDVLAWWSISEARHGRPDRHTTIDKLGAACIAVTLAALSFGFIEANTYGWGSAQIIGSFVLTVAGLAAFLLVEHRRSGRGVPALMPLSVWRHPRFVGANLGGAVFFLALYGMLFVYSVYAEKVLDLSPFRTGLAFVPMTGSMAVLAVLAGRLVAAMGVRRIAVSGLFVSAAGAASLVFTDSSVSTGGLSARFALIGIGFGLVSAPLTVTAVSALPGELTAIASSIYNAMRQVGAVVGVAVLGAIASIGGRGSGHRVHEAMVLTTGLLLACAVALMVLLRQNPKGAVEQ